MSDVSTSRPEPRAHRTLVLTAAKVGLQAGFFLLAPLVLRDEVAAAMFLAFAIQAFLCPSAALGSQFRLVRSLSTHSPNLRSATSTFYVGLLVLVVAVPILLTVYGDVMFTIFSLLAYLTMNYVRIFADAIAQGTGKYNVSQSAYLGFWATKFAFLGLVHLVDAAPGFSDLALLEVVTSIPWVAFAVHWLWKRKLGPSLSIRWAEEGILTVTTASRNAWMEADRLLLPLVATSAFYVDYSIIGRVSTGAVALVSSFLASVTPHIIRSRPEDLDTFLRKGKMPVAAATGAYVVGACVVVAMYPSVRGEMALALGIGVLIPPLVYWSHIYLDYVFYNESPTKRLISNLIGTFIVAAAALVCGPVGSASVVVAGIVLSYGVTGLIARRWCRALVAHPAGVTPC